MEQLDPSKAVPGLPADNSDPFTFFMRGHTLIWRAHGRASGNRDRTVIELLECHSLSLMLLGQEMEGAMVNEEIIRRFAHAADVAHHVARAHFNAGCAYVRLGRIEKGIEQLSGVSVRLMERTTLTDDDHDLLRLADEGIRRATTLLATMGADRLRALRLGVGKNFE